MHLLWSVAVTEVFYTFFVPVHREGSISENRNYHGAVGK